MDILGHLTSKLHTLPKKDNITHFNFNLTQETLMRLYLTLVCFGALHKVPLKARKYLIPPPHIV